MVLVTVVLAAGRFKHLFERRVAVPLSGWLLSMTSSGTTSGRSSAVVTGAGRGIGRATAELLVQRGYAVVLTDVDAAAVRRTADEIGAVAGIAQDVREEASHVAVAAEALRHGPLAVWVNNAGVGDDGTLADLSSDAVERLVDVNLKGVLWGMRAAMAAFDEVQGGDIVNVASLSGLGPVPGLSTYAATKAAVVSLTTSVALEVPTQVRVHALCPTGVAGPMVDAMDPGGARLLVQAGGRILRPEEVATAVVGLLGSRRVVRSLPVLPGVLMRGGAVLPSRSAAGFELVRWLGRRRRG